ncbi:MAG: STAS domain-containing protein [candidate division Zixibacteria bacterium]
MAYTFKEENGIVVFELAGKIMGTPEDMSIIDKFGELAEQEKVQLVLDLSRVDWMNSRGLGICVSGVTTTRNRGGDLRLAAPSENVKTFLDKCKMFAVIKSYDTVEEAIKSFQ